MRNVGLRMPYFKDIGCGCCLCGWITVSVIFLVMLDVEKYREVLYGTE